MNEEIWTALQQRHRLGFNRGFMAGVAFMIACKLIADDIVEVHIRRPKS